MLEEAKPFLKWAGGKRQLLEELAYGLPDFGDYHEPFIGGGALFFRLEAMGKINTAYLSDSNEELINVYGAIKSSVFELIEELASPKYANKSEAYYKVRASRPVGEVERAARFIYLNKTAFNGLYRVNSKGGFNVPFGKYTNPKILDEKNLLLVHRALQKDALFCGDFAIALKSAKKGDFVYLDPPYVPVSKTATFTNYTQEGFSEKDQVRLLKAFKELDSKGCYVLLSNSYAEFVAELYGEFEQQTVHANRMINCKAGLRGKVRELLVRNWEPKVAQRKLLEAMVEGS